jgi:hypothetical protein
MKMRTIAILVGVVATMAASTLHAGVSVNMNEPTEKAVAFRVLDDKYISTAPSNSLDCTGTKIGSKEKFTIVDLNGGDLTDGHQVRIRYTPNDPTKSSYWREIKEGVKRGKDGDTFTIKRVDTKCALQTVSGKFVAAPVAGGLLGVVEKQDGAMLMELVDLSSVVPGTKVPKNLPTLAIVASSGSKSDALPPSTTVAPAPEPPTNPAPATGQPVSPPASP